ncbi:MAG: MCE family protein, partial [Planctomycetes bacterium]|nr:MCE family protein [Planctomycetota bacterium]
MRPRGRGRVRLAWLLPLGALIIAGYAGWQAWGHTGPRIKVHFDQGFGLRVGDVLRHRGIPVGEVKKLALADDREGVHVELLLDHAARDLAREGSLFWVVRPKIGWGGITGLDTLAGARYLDVLPGEGEPQNEFDGLEDTPITALCPPGGLEIIVQAAARGGIRPGSQVTYRQLPIGRVVTTGLSTDAGMIEMRVYIDPPFTALIRQRTCFWETSGVTFKVGLKDGVKLGFDSPEALLSGALAVATP